MRRLEAVTAAEVGRGSRANAVRAGIGPRVAVSDGAAGDPARSRAAIRRKSHGRRA